MFMKQWKIKIEKCISVCWVCSVKQIDKGSKPKACLAARAWREIV